MEYGYGGNVLRVDLTERRNKVEKLKKNWIKNVIGGRAANSKRLYEELDPGVDPLDPDNILLFGIGPLTGSMFPASAYFTISAKSPLTGILGDSAAGGQFGAEMKLTGFDQFIITGKASNLMYLMVSDSDIKFVDCPHYKNDLVVDVTRKIREENRNFSIQVAAIGPAGENKVSYASVISSGNRASGRTGMGAVMGSKNLKAVAVCGHKSVEIAEPLAFLSEVTKIKKEIFAHNEYNKRYNLGTTMLMTDLNGIGILPTNHFQKGVCSYLDKVSGERLAENYKVKNKSCFNCNLHCSRYYVCGDFESEGPEYETLCGFTTRIGASNLEFALEMNYYLNQVGLDSLSTCEVIGWLMECQEKGLLTPKDVGGIEVSWGDVDKIREIVQMITYRKGIGNEFAEGTTKFSQKFNEEVRKLVMQVKGLDIICGDPRGLKAYGLTYAIASRGGDHLRAEPFFELTERWEEANRRFGTEKAADRLAEEGKAALVTYSEKIALLTDCMTMCKNIGLCMDIINFENASNLLTYGTGIDYTPDYLRKILAEAIERDYKLNKKFGLKRQDDTLPDRFRKEPLLEGPTSGSIVDIEKMVDQYYQLHRFDEVK
ncbi:MAG: aldehyde ferredoxin oxidoreductase family protein [Candidatus Heimdallarchaeota archaeon]|nr:MAG: aldehyde ferredoxin oxidoreductase family protein [Candidatus Heimdallarchaeota archaeon]